MKIRPVVIVILIIILIKSNVCEALCYVNHHRNAIDTPRKLFDIKPGSNAVTKGLNGLVCDIGEDTLYMVNNGKLAKINLKTGKISTDATVNALLAKKIKANQYANRISVRRGGYYISFLSELDFISTTGKVTTICQQRLAISDFTIVGKNIIMALYDSAVEVIDMSGKTLAKIPYSFGAIGFFNCLNGVAYDGEGAGKVAEFTVDHANHIKTAEYPSTELFKKYSKDMFIAYSDDGFFFAFDDAYRNTIYLIKKGESKVYKTISLGNECRPSPNELQDGEGAEPDFRVIFYKGLYYVVALARHRLKVLTFAI